MKAMVMTAYGSVDGLQLQEVEKPTPKANEVLIRIHATTVTTGDCEIRGLRLALWIQIPMRLVLGLRKPKPNMILGTELAGVVEAVGGDVKRLKVGDAVFGSASLRFGTNAEYKCLPEEGFVTLKPSNMSFEEAATVPFGGRDALHFLRIGNVQRGDKVLIVGAGGSIGTYGVQLAKYLGAEVTGVDSGEKLEMVRSIGADHVIDYTQEDFTQSGERYDVIFETVGKSSFSGGLQALKEKGRYVLANPSLSDMLRAKWTSMRSDKQVLVTASGGKVEDLIYLRGLIEAGEIKAVIDRRYPLAETAEAHRYVDTGRKQGNVVVVVVPDTEG
ncbi:MAG: zinc-binding dehydrogenase [Chloroflexi bacterium]|nr:zinc-binding dehydrogenase [Chloroflexota bacterium]